MKLHDLSAVPGSTKVSLKRVGRIMAPVKVKLLVKATKVKKQVGASIRPGFEGGQMPLDHVYLKEVSMLRKKIIAINVGSLESFENGAVVDTQALIDARSCQQML